MVVTITGGSYSYMWVRINRPTSGNDDVKRTNVLSTVTRLELPYNGRSIFESSIGDTKMAMRKSSSSLRMSIAKFMCSVRN